MALFTILLEYRGGMSVSQAEGDDATAAFRLWLDEIATKCGEVIKPSDLAALRLEFSGTELTPIDGLSNVWCTTAVTGDDLALVNIVTTQVDERIVL